MTRLTYQGVINANPRGFGFARTDAGEEFFVAPSLMKTLVPGDRATFTVEGGKKPGEFQVAQVLKVDREPTVWLGEMEARNGRVMLVADDPCFVGIELRSMRYPAADQVVAVRVGPASGYGSVICGELVGVLGPRSRVGFDYDYALARKDLKVIHDAASLQSARAQGTEVDVGAALSKGWRDLRDVALVTIDGESTRDFDDAVSAHESPEGFRVTVAIADVCAYVTPGSALDREAFERCTSVYLPGKTVPMLPEALSTGLCSLVAGKDRLALVCEALVSPTGQLQNWTFTRAVIRSHAQLTYSQVFERMRKAGSTPLGSAAVEQSLDVLQSLFQVLTSARKQRGVLDFNDKEPRLTQRADGGLDIVWEARTDAHRLVEELMLLANQAAASEMAKGGAPGMFRHQQAPALADWNELRGWLSARGVAITQLPSLSEMALTLGAAQDREDFPVIEAKIRKVMQFAVYDTENSSHFSLGYSTYTHFTSPIRRYSDLVVHRILLGEKVSLEQRQLAATRCSAKSRASRFAERFVWDRIKKRVLVRDVPRDLAMDARIVTMSRRGVKVVFDEWQCAAFIEAQSLVSAGMSWDNSLLAWKNSEVLELGRSLKACWLRLDEHKARCELSAIIA